MLQSKLSKRITAIICIVTLMFGAFSFKTMAASVSAASFADALTEEMLTNEVTGAITKNLDLDLSDILPEGVSVSFESNSNAIAIDGEVAHVVRNLYHDTPVTLTATVTHGSESVKKELNFTVLKQTTKVHLSENFYYPNNKGNLFTEEDSLTVSKTMPSPTRETEEGWAFAFATELEGDSVAANRFKAITDEVNGDYFLNAYRDVAVDSDYNFLHYVFGDKPSGKVSVKADVTFDHEPGTQIYVFRAFGNYYVDGSYERARIFEINYKYDQNGAASTYMSYYSGSEVKSAYIKKEDMSKVGEETELEWLFDTDAQEWDMYINGTKVTEESIPFYERDKEDANRTNFVDINDIDFNVFRTFTGGKVYIDDLIVTSTKENNTDRFNVTEEMLTNEPRDVITENLDLNPENFLPDGYSVSFTSNNDAIVISENTGYVTRDLYRDTNVEITATVSGGGKTWTNKLYFTVLRQTTKVHMSENFYYPEGKGMILYDVPGIKRSETNATPPIAGTYGWSSRYATQLSEDTTSGQRFKSYIDVEDEKYLLHSYRPVGMEEGNSTYYILGEKPKGDIIHRMRMKFEHTDAPQIYVFRTYGIFKVNGENKRVWLNETNFRYESNGAYNIYMPVHNGEKSQTIYFSKDYLPEVGEWADFEWRYYEDSLTLDLFINDVKVNSEPIPFYDALNPSVDRTEFVGYNDFEFNTFRQYGKGNLFIDDVSITDNPKWYNENPEIFYLYNNLKETDFTSEDKDAVTADLDFENHKWADYISENDITVTYSSSDTDVLSGDGTVTRGKYDTPVTVTATISKNGASVTKELSYTVLCSDEYSKISNIAKLITPEVFTAESVKHITKNLDLDYTKLSGIDFSDVEITFESSNPSVIDVNSEKGVGIVKRPLEDTTVKITASIMQNGKNILIDKELEYRVLSKGKAVYYSDSFYYPESIGKGIHQITESEMGITTYSDAPYKTALEVDKNKNYFMHTWREGTSGSQKFVQYKFPTTSQYKVAFETDLKFNHSDTPQYYFFHMYGNYLLPDGTKERAQIVDCCFYYEGYREFMFTRRQDNAGTVRSVYLMETAPILDEWFTLRIEINTATQTADYFINGVKINETPIGLYECTTRKDQALYNVEDIRFTNFRTQSGQLSFDNFAAYTVAGDVVSNSTFSSDGRTVGAIEEVLDGTIDVNVRLYNQTEEAKKVSVAVCEYQNSELTNISLKSIDLDTDSSTAEELIFEDFKLSENPENSVVKVFLLDKNIAYPYQEQLYFKNELNREVISGEMTCPVSGRSYNWVDFNGKNMIRSYFTMQGWSADGNKFFVRDDDFRIYEYNLTTSSVKYIDHCEREHNIVTTPLNGLFYINRDSEIIRMDIDTYEKKVVGVIPEEYADAAGMLQVMDTEEKLSVEWSDKKLAEGSRFPILDIETGEWDLTHSYVFDTEWYDPNHVSINPVKPNLLLFCHEGTSVNDRLWVLNTDTDEYYNVFVPRFYSAKSAGEIACHEMWTHDGEHIVFHKSSGSSAIGYPGIVSIKYDGTERNYINSDYAYNHVATSPVSNRWAVADTGYSNGEYSDIVLIDCYTGVSHVVARVKQTGINPGHCHPAFNLDGTKVWFGHYDETGKIIRIGWADVSDIIANAPDGGWYDLSGSCDSFSYADCDSEVEVITHNGQALYKLPKGNVMRVNVKNEVAYQTEGNVKVTITYLDEGTTDFNFTYYTFEIGETRNRLVKNTEKITRTGTGELKTVTLNLTGACLDNMERLKTDFTISGFTDVKIASVTAELIN